MGKKLIELYCKKCYTSYLYIKRIRKCESCGNELIQRNIMGEETCKCGHRINDHSYDPDKIEDDNLYCDICDCKNLEVKE